jgi:hypothetical protein
LLSLLWILNLVFVNNQFIVFWLRSLVTFFSILCFICYFRRSNRRLRCKFGRYHSSRLVFGPLGSVTYRFILWACSVRLISIEKSHWLLIKCCHGLGTANHLIFWFHTWPLSIYCTKWPLTITVTDSNGCLNRLWDRFRRLWRINWWRDSLFSKWHLLFYWLSMVHLTWKWSKRPFIWSEISIKRSGMP